METAKLKLFTVEDIENLSSERRAELIDGVWYDMSAPSREHQRISSNLTYQLESYIRNNKGNCQVYTAPFAVYLKDDNKNYVEPDISVICDKNKLTEKGCKGNPDWIIEILSPATAMYDSTAKLFLYKETGIREYWIVNPQAKVIIVYDFENNVIGNYKFGDKIPVGIYNGNLIIDTTDIEK